MLPEITNVQNALEGFATQIEAIGSPDTKFHEGYMSGWNSVPLTARDLSERVRALSIRLGQLREADISAGLRRKLSVAPEQIAWFQSQTLPNLPSGHLNVVLSNFDILMSSVEQLVPSVPMPDWDEVAGSDLIPRELSRRLRHLESALARLEPKIGAVEGKLTAINDAHAAALDLPTDMQSLKEARDEIAGYRLEAREATEQLDDFQRTASATKDNVIALEEEARKSITNIDAAYSAATTVGLAASFSERATSLTKSTRWWVGMLFAALLGGAIIGYFRLEAFQAVLRAPQADNQLIWVNAVMSLLSIAAPVWFAWLATRQIGQRFRLAEDYAFKASVARAYEGYRKEAARLDPALEARLFASALDRLDEQPLRFLATEEHGSPYESLLASTGFQKALEKVPSLRDAVSAALQRAEPSTPTSVRQTGN